MISSDATPRETAWRQLHAIAGICAVIVAVLIPIQAALFIAFPPPADVTGYFELFQKNPILGLIDLDLLLTLDNLLVAVIYLGLFAVLRETNRSIATLGLVLGLIGTVLYLVSREATFTMLSLSGQYAAATTAQQKTVLLSAGQAMLALYNGSCFDISYVLGGITVVLMSLVALRTRIPGRPAAVIGLITGAFMLLPPTIGPVGLYASMTSLLPTMAWIILLAIGFFRLAKKPG